MSGHPIKTCLIPARLRAQEHVRQGKMQNGPCRRNSFCAKTIHVALSGHGRTPRCQKGFDLIAGCIDSILREHARAIRDSWIGGMADFEHYFGDLPGRHPGRAGSFIDSTTGFAHLIEAGCDFLPHALQTRTVAP